METVESQTWFEPESVPAGVGPNSEQRPTVPVLRSIYLAMLRGRIVDQRMTKLQRQGRIGFHVGAEGEEAAIVASAAAMRDQDWLFPCYREAGAALYRGFSLQVYVDNLYGNANDVACGRQMPDHISGRSVHFGSVTSPIGTQITQAVGFAWAAKQKREDCVTGVYFGDGATSSNDFHAGMNFAAVFQIPTVFLLRNNGWAISVPASRQTLSRTYAVKAAAYGMRAARCDGNDAGAVYATVRQAVELAADGGGPTLIELVTYRAGPHSTSDDPTAYRDPEQVPAQLRQDPLERLRNHLQQQLAWSDVEEERFVASVNDELQACIARAEHAAPPAVETLFEQVYEDLPAHLAEQQRACCNGPRARRAHP